MTQEEIEKGNEFLDSYMGSKGKYISHKDPYGGEVWGSYRPHNYYGSLDLLVPVIQKIEKEKVNIRLNNNGCHFYCRESENSFESYDKTLSWSNNVFKVVIEYLETKNKIYEDYK